MNRRVVWIANLIMLLVVVIALFPACKPAAPAKKPLKMGFILELTGVGAVYGEATKKTIEWVLKKNNYQVAGREIQPIWEDNATDPTKAIEKAKKLIELDKVDLLYGPLFSDAQDVLAPYLADKKIMDYAQFGASWELSKYGNWIVYPGTLYSFDIPGGDYAYEQGWRTMATIGADYVAGYDLVNGAADRFKELGGTVVQQQWAPYGTPDYAPYINAFKKADVWLGMLLFPDVMIFIKQLHQFGIKTPYIMCEVEATPLGALGEIGDAILGQKGIITMYEKSLDNPANKKFVADLKAETGMDAEASQGAAYIGMTIILEGLKATEGDARLEVLRPAIINLKLDTIAGPVAFSKNGFAIGDRYIAEIVKVDGKYAWKPIRTYKAVRDPRDK